MGSMACRQSERYRRKTTKRCSCRFSTRRGERDVAFDFCISLVRSLRDSLRVQRGKTQKSVFSPCGSSMAAPSSLTCGGVIELTRVIGFLMPCPVHVFGNQERDKAIDWLGSLPEVAAISHRLLPDSGVIVVEVKQALRSQDFDALAVTADTWIEAHGSLQGLVIHAREFPGWENLGSLLRHLQFVRDHHRKVKRIALAADAKLASLAPKIGEHFIQAEVKSFGYDALDTAIAWAAGFATQTAASSRSASN